VVAGGVACGCALLRDGLIAGTQQRQQAPDRLLLEAAAAGNVIAVRGLLSSVPKWRRVEARSCARSGLRGAVSASGPGGQISHRI
jgi:hypothetical protein